MLFSISVFTPDFTKLNVYIYIYIYIYNVGKQFFLKTKLTYDSRNLIYVVICPTYKEEYIDETESWRKEWKRKFHLQI